MAGKLNLKEILDIARKLNLYEQHLQQIVDSMGPDLLKKMTPEERMEGLTVAERLQGLTVDGILAGLSREDLQSLEPAVKMALLRLLDPSNGTQQE